MSIRWRFFNFDTQMKNRCQSARNPIILTPRNHGGFIVLNSGHFQSLLLMILRNLLLLKVNDWPWVRSKKTLGAIIILLVGITVFTWDGWISLLPFISVSVTCIGYWTNSAKDIRLSQLIGSPCTLVYDAQNPIFLKCARKTANLERSIYAHILRNDYNARKTAEILTRKKSNIKKVRVNSL